MDVSAKQNNPGRKTTSKVGTRVPISFTAAVEMLNRNAAREMTTGPLCHAWCSKERRGEGWGGVLQAHMHMLDADVQCLVAMCVPVENCVGQRDYLHLERVGYLRV